ncbi:MAG: DUF5050 domain-containing protein [Polyangiaceae bacterium]
MRFSTLSLALPLIAGLAGCAFETAESEPAEESDATAESSEALSSVLTWADMPTSTITDGAHVYFTALDSNYQERIYRIPVNGGTKQSLVACTGCGKLALDSSYVYFNTGAALFRIAKGGGSKTKLAASAVDGFADMAVSGSYLYFAGPDGVKRVPKAGGSVKVLSTKAKSVRGLALDSSYVYWVNIDGGTIRRVPKAGGTTTTLLTATEPFDIVVDASRIYWTNLQGLIWRANKDGSNPWYVAAGQATPTDLASNGTHLFWTTDNSVKRLDKERLGITTLASGQNGPEAITVYGSAAYWSNYTGDQVMKATF